MAKPLWLIWSIRIHIRVTELNYPFFVKLLARKPKSFRSKSKSIEFLSHAISARWEHLAISVPMLVYANERTRMLGTFRSQA